MHFQEEFLSQMQFHNSGDMEEYQIHPKLENYRLFYKTHDRSLKYLSSPTKHRTTSPAAVRR